MEKPFSDDVSVNVLRRMKEGGFDFARIHPIDFFAIFPSEREARQAAGQFRGESLRAQVVARDDGSWNLQVSKVMYATHAAIGAFEHDLEEVVAGRRAGRVGRDPGGHFAASVTAAGPRPRSRAGAPASGFPSSKAFLQTGEGGKP